MFICKRNNVGCVSLSSNWVESECFSDRTRCIWKDGALEGGGGGGVEERRGRSNHDERKFKKCLFAFPGVAFKRGNEITLAALQRLKAFARQMYHRHNLCF